MDKPIRNGVEGAIYRAQLGRTLDVEPIVSAARARGVDAKGRYELFRVEGQMDGYQDGAKDWTVYLRRSGLWVDQVPVHVCDRSYIELEWGDGPIVRTTRVEVGYPGVAVHVQGGWVRAYFVLDVDGHAGVVNVNVDDILHATVTPGRPSEARHRRSVPLTLPTATAPTFGPFPVPEFAWGLRIWASVISPFPVKVLDVSSYKVLWHNQTALAPVQVTASDGMGFLLEDGFMPPAQNASNVTIIGNDPGEEIEVLLAFSYEWRIWV